MHDRAIATMANQYEVVYDLGLSNGVMFSDLRLERLMTQISKSRQYFTLNYFSEYLSSGTR